VTKQSLRLHARNVTELVRGTKRGRTVIQWKYDGCTLPNPSTYDSAVAGSAAFCLDGDYSGLGADLGCGQDQGFWKQRVWGKASGGSGSAAHKTGAAHKSATTHKTTAAHKAGTAPKASKRGKKTLTRRRKRRPSARAQRIKLAFVASTELRPMAQQLATMRTPAAYAG